LPFFSSNPSAPPHLFPFYITRADPLDRVPITSPWIAPPVFPRLVCPLESQKKGRKAKKTKKECILISYFPTPDRKQKRKEKISPPDFLILIDWL
jgi:hypothetical protein